MRKLDQNFMYTLQCTYKVTKNNYDQMHTEHVNLNTFCHNNNMRIYFINIPSHINTVKNCTWKWRHKHDDEMKIDNAISIFPLLCCLKINNI